MNTKYTFEAYTKNILQEKHQKMQLNYSFAKKIKFGSFKQKFKSYSMFSFQPLPYQVKLFQRTKKNIGHEGSELNNQGPFETQVKKLSKQRRRQKKKML